VHVIHRRVEFLVPRVAETESHPAAKGDGIVFGGHERNVHQRPVKAGAIPLQIAVLVKPNNVDSPEHVKAVPTGADRGAPPLARLLYGNIFLKRLLAFACKSRLVRKQTSDAHGNKDPCD
jgi:hypothetical protein